METIVNNYHLVSANTIMVRTGPYYRSTNKALSSYCEQGLIMETIINQYHLLNANIIIGRTRPYHVMSLVVYGPNQISFTDLVVKKVYLP